jgi:hypothetical protein
MKSFTKRQYLIALGGQGCLFDKKGNWSKRNKLNNGKVFTDVGFCICTRYGIDSHNPAQLECYDECPNCLGFGFQPIPWSEVNK